MSSLSAWEMLNIAGVQVGTKETAPDTIKYNSALGYEQGTLWCAVFLSWCFKQSNSLNLINNRTWSDTALWAKWFHDHGQWGIVPKNGAIVFFNFGNPHYDGRWEGIHHVGVVLGVPSGKSYIRTIEGNTRLNKSDPGSVMIRSRAKTLDSVHWPAQQIIAGYGYPNYATKFYLNTVPNVVGCSGRQATEILAAAGYKVKIINTPSYSVPKWTIFWQSPAAKTQVYQGTTVTIQQSLY